MTSIFLSSTCYDLIDVREELARQLRDLGLRVVRSDAADFQVEPDQSSIETCLARVRDSNFFLCILSSRYGASLAQAGYDDVSATHLEYREARREKKPILFFVRDRLEADFAVWKKGGRDPLFQSVFAQPKDALNLFGFMEEHCKLEKDSQVTNWMTSFESVVDLKVAVEARLSAPIEAARLKHLVANDLVPLFDVAPTRKILDRTGGRDTHIYQVRVRSIGTRTAINARVGLYNTKAEWQSLGSMGPGDVAEAAFRLPGALTMPGGGKPLVCAVDFSLPSGEMMESVYYTWLDSDGTIRRFVPHGITLLRGSGFTLTDGPVRGAGAI